MTWPSDLDPIASEAKLEAVRLLMATGLNVFGPLTDAQLRSSALPVTLPPGGGGLTDAELRATPVPVLSALDAATLAALETVTAVGPLTNTELRAVPVPVSGTFFQGTQPVSGPLTDVQLRAAAVPVSGPLTDAQLRASAVPVSMAGGAGDPAATLAVTATGAAAAAVALSLPAAGAGLFHYITHIEIVRYASAAVTGTATPILVTSSNLPGFPVWTFPRFGAIGQIPPGGIQPQSPLVRPLRSAVANTATLISCPATTGVLWRVNVHYYTAP